MEGLEMYINGVMHTACLYASWIGCSEISAACFPTESYLDRFCESFGVPHAQVQLIPAERTLPQILATWLGGDQAKYIDDLLWLLNGKLGNVKTVSRVKESAALLDTLSRGNGGAGPYYFMEDLFFAVFEQAAVCFFLGNNE